MKFPYGRGYSGRLAEADMVGGLASSRAHGDRVSEAERLAKFKRDLASFRPDEKTGYLPYEAAMRFAREHQIEDPAAPSRPFAQELLKQIADILMDRFERPDVYARDLLFFTAVNTPLDVFHGVDAWVELRDWRTGRYHRVTLDVAKNDEKVVEGHKADIIVPALQDYPSPPRDRVMLPQEIARYKSEKKAFSEGVSPIAEAVVAKAFGSSYKKRA